MIELEGLKDARPDRPPLTDGVGRAMAAGKRRRRTRFAVAGTVVAVLAVLVPIESVALSHRSSAPARPAPQPAGKPPLYAAVGELAWFGSPKPHICLIGDLASTGEPMTGPQTCRYETTVRNVDLTQFAKTRKDNGVTETIDSFRLVGTYASGILTLTERPVQAKPKAPVLDLPVPCPAPAGGWKNTGPVSPPDEDVMGRFTTAHANISGGWWLGNGGVIVLGVTQDVAATRRALDARLHGAVCVTKVAHTDRELTAVMDTLNHLPRGESDALHLSSYGPDPVTSTTKVSPRIADAPTRRFFATHFKPGLVQLEPFLVQIR